MPRIGVGDIIEPVVEGTPVEETHILGRHPSDLSTDEELKKLSEKSTMAMFSAYPQGIHFAGQMDEEEIILLLRAHLITITPWFLWVLIGVLVPIFLIVFLNVAGILAGVSSGMVIILTLYWYVGLSIFAFLNFLFWYFNVGIITNERIMDIDWNSVTHHDVAVTQMSKVQNAKADISGVMASIFNFGSVYVETAGNTPNIEFLNVKHAQLVVRKIQELMSK